jgi:hypothetical protein
MLYYRGETRARADQRIKERFGIAVPPRTFSTWLAEYRELTTYARLRNQVPIERRPRTLIRSVRLHHQRVYDYRVHQGKLASIVATSEHQRLQPMADYSPRWPKSARASSFRPRLNRVFDADAERDI